MCTYKCLSIVWRCPFLYTPPSNPLPPPTDIRLNSMPVGDLNGYTRRQDKPTTVGGLLSFWTVQYRIPCTLKNPLSFYLDTVDVTDSTKSR